MDQIKFLICRWMLLCSVLPSAERAAASQQDDDHTWFSEIASADPINADFRDLEPIGRAVGNARVVMLGEQSHGVGNIFQMKTRLVKYLHEHLDFDVVIFEGDMFGCNEASEHLDTSLEPDLEYVRNLCFHQVWSDSIQMQHFFSYLGQRATGQKALSLAGFDSQMFASSYIMLPSKLKAFLHAIGSPRIWTAEWIAFVDQFEKVIERDHTVPPPDRPTQESFYQRIREINNEIETRSNSELALWWQQLLNNIEGQARYSWSLYDDGANNPYTSDVMNLRDEQMARNLLWLLNHKFQGRRVIVWAASYHLARNLENAVSLTSFPPWAFEESIPAGDIVWDRLGNEMFSIAFTASGGIEGIFGNNSLVSEPRPGSIEELFKAIPMTIGFLNIRDERDTGSWIDKPLITNLFTQAGKDTAYNLTLADTFDGLILFKSVTPNEKIMTPKISPSGKVQCLRYWPILHTQWNTSGSHTFPCSPNFFSAAE